MCVKKICVRKNGSKELGDELEGLIYFLKEDLLFGDPKK